MFIPDDPKLRDKELEDSFSVGGSPSGFKPDAKFEQAVAESPEKEKGWYGKLSDTLMNFSEGVAKGELSTADNIQKLALKIGEKFNLPGQIAEIVTNGRITAKELSPQKTTLDQILPEGTNKEQVLTPEGTAQDVGFVAERAAEFFLAGTKATQGINAAANAAKAKAIASGAGSAISKLAELSVKSAGQGAFGGGLTALQRGEFDSEAKTNALISAAFPILAEVGSAVGSKIINSVIKPSQADVKNGFDVANIKKHGVGGSLNTSLKKTSNQLNALGDQLDDKLANSDAVVDINKVYDSTAAKIGDKKRILFGRVSDMKSGLSELKSDIDDMAKIMGDGFDEGAQAFDMTRVPIQVANNQIKRGAGTKGAWVYGRMDKDAKAIDQVYSTFYSELKNEIEKVGPSGIGSLNKSMSELIPIQSALLRRIPVAERSNILGLGGNMAVIGSIFDPRALVTMVPIIASQSGGFGNMLMTASENFLGKAAATGIKAIVSSK